ncbi:MAG: phosphotransferase family protein [Arenicellales bacterium]
MELRLDGLMEYIRRRTESGRVSLSTRRLDGGAIQENHALDVTVANGPMHGEHKWVLRTDSPSGVRVSRSREEEFALLNAAHNAGLTVPKPLWLCSDPAIIGRPFYIMERVPGTADGRRLVRSNWTVEQRRSILQALAGELARLHDIDTNDPALSFLRPASGSPALHRVTQYRTYLDELRDPQPVVEWALRWLELNPPACDETVLCHCDFRTGNIMIDGDRVTGILDWEFADRSSPVEDLGWFCARCWRFGTDRFEAGGIGDKEDFVTAYERESGRAVDRDALAYWQIMAEARWAVIALQQTARHLCGREESLELALTGYMVPEMEMNLIQAIERAGAC